MTILIVDDDPNSQEVLSTFLDPFGYRIRLASSGAEALAQCRVALPDLVLLDVMMPGMDGFEVCRELRADPLLAPVPVVLVTALDDRASRLRGIEAGADDFLSKPFDRVELRARVAMIVRLNRYRRILDERTRVAWVMEHAPDGYLALRADGSIALANPPARRLLGLADGEPLPAEPLLRILSRRFSCEPAAAWAGWPDPPPTGLPRYLVSQPDADRQPTWIRVEALAQGLEQDYGILVRLHDISAQVGTQREMWTFHAMVSHKLRTPLISLYGLEIIKRGAGSMPQETLTSLVDAALRGAKRLQLAVDDVLSSTRLPALAHGDACCPMIDLPTLLGEAAGAAGVADVGLRLDPQISAASLRLSRPAVQAILQELLENARKFHPAQSPRVELMAGPGRSGMALLTVRDDGRHLLPEQLARLGVPYMQIEATFTGEVPGMGLGTAMVGAALWEVGGTLRFANRADRPGLSAELEIPLAERSGAAAG